MGIRLQRLRQAAHTGNISALHASLTDVFRTVAIGIILCVRGTETAARVEAGEGC
jgi:hypothetical protein